MTALGFLLHLLALAARPRPAAARPQQQRRRPAPVGWVTTSGARRQTGEPWIERTTRSWWTPASRQNSNVRKGK